MGLKQKYNLTATGMEPAGIERDIKVKIYRFEAPADAKPGDEITVNWDDAVFVHEQTFSTDREFSNAIEFMHSRPSGGVTLMSLDGQDLSDLDFSRLTLQGIRMRNCDLSRTDLSAARICGADFTGSKMDGAYLSDAIAGALTQKATDADITYRMPPAVFDGAEMEGVRLGGGAFHGVSFHDAKMKNTKLAYALLHDSDFTNADLEGADFEGASIKGTNLMQAKVTPAQLAKAKGTPLCQPGHYACAFKRKSRANRPA